jgi:hypothetical protein
MERRREKMERRDERAELVEKERRERRAEGGRRWAVAAGDLVERTGVEGASEWEQWEKGAQKGSA